MTRNPEEVQHPGQCLAFIHNPRTGGTTIDGLNLNLPKDQRAYYSLMEAALDEAAGGPHWPNLTPGELFDRSHGAELSDESSGQAAYIYGRYYLPYMNFRYVTWTTPFGGYQQTCQDLHTPPQYDAQVRQAVERSNCTTFCSVRDPMSRLLSAYKFRSFGECSTAGFDRWIRQTFPLHEAISYCHVYPQVEYVYNAPSKAAATKQWCQRIIKFENFASDFDAVMEEFGKPLRLSGTSYFSTGGCPIDVTALSQDAKDRVYDYYKADYEAFGYPRPM